MKNGLEMDIHIGEMIKSEFDRQGRKVTWFDEQRKGNRSNVYSIFSRKNIDVEMLILISRVLGHNFLQDIAPWAEGQEWKQLFTNNNESYNQNKKIRKK